MALSAKQMIAAIAERHLMFTPEDIAAARAATVREQRGVRGECVRDDLPLVLN
jgi:hypothetical protein